MGTVADKLELLLNTKRDLCKAIASKSSIAPAPNATFRDYVTLMNSIVLADYSSQSITLVNDGYFKARPCWYDAVRPSGVTRYARSVSVSPVSRTTISDMLVGGMLTIPVTGRHAVYKDDSWTPAHFGTDYEMLNFGFETPGYIIVIPKLTGMLITFA